MTNYLSKQEYANDKRALTRTINLYMEADPQRVIDHAEGTMRSWEERGLAFPDDWARWQRAADDARFKLALSQW